VDYEGTLVPSQSHPMREKTFARKRTSAHISQERLDAARRAHLYPFFGRDGSYEQLMLRVDERKFWQELRTLTQEHRPHDIAHLVKKRFSRGETRHGWELRHRWATVRPSDSPYVALPTHQQETFIDAIVAGMEQEVREIEGLFAGHRTRGHLYVQTHREERTYHRKLRKPVTDRKLGGTTRFVHVRSDGHVAPTWTYKGGMKEVFVDVEREKAKIVYVKERLATLGPACDAVVRASTALFATEYDLTQNLREKERLEAKLQTRGASLRAPARASVEKQIKDLSAIILNAQESAVVLEYKIHDYLALQVSPAEKIPRRVVVGTTRVNKRPLENERMRRALGSLVSWAENEYCQGNFKEAMTLQHALRHLGKEYVVVRNNAAYELLERSVHQDQEMVSVDAHAVKTLVGSLSSIADEDIVALYVRERASGERQNVGGTTRQNHLADLDHTNELVIEITCTGAPVRATVRKDRKGNAYALLQNIGPAALDEGYGNEHLRDAVLVSALGRAGAFYPATLHDYRGDAVCARERLPEFIRTLEKRYANLGDATFDGSALRFPAHASVRIDVREEGYASAPYWRASFFGVEPMHLTHRERKETFAERVSAALYKPQVVDWAALPLR
jgi:hypothetical protein